MTVTDLRPVTIGGSTIGAICGVHPYRSARRVSAEMLGLVAPQEETPAMTLGKQLEPVIAGLAAKRGYEVLPAPADGFVGKPRWIVGHPDYFTVLDGERAVLEVKNVGEHVARDWHEHEPPYVTTQCLWYCHLTGLRRFAVAALLGGRVLGIYKGELDEVALGYMLAQAEAFRKLVMRGKLAEGDGSADAAAITREIWPEASPGKVLRATGELWRKVQDARDKKWRRDVCERQWKEAQAELEAAMGDAEVMISPHDDEVARFKTITSHPMDTKALRAALPHVAEEYTTERTYRRFDLLA